MQRLLVVLGRVSNNYYIVNCITMQWLKLPPVREVPGKLHAGLVCDSGYNNHDRMESWFRVVRLILDLHNNIIVEIFSSDTGEWCELQTSSRPEQQPFSLESATMDISGHKRLLLRSTGGVVAFGRMIFWQSSKWSIFGFDPNNCDCYFINLGTGFDEMVDCMGVCNGCLRICMVLRFFDHLELTVLELKDYKEGGMWRSEHMVEFQDMDSSNTWLREIVKKKDLLDYGLRALAHDIRDGDVVYLEIKQQLIMGNMKKKRLKLIHDIADDCFYKLGSIYTFVLPWCPNPIPSLPQNITMKKRKV